MNLKIIETSIENNEQFDISEMVSSPVWTTGTESQPGMLEFKMVVDNVVFLRAGDTIEAYADGKKFFKGYVFIRRKKKGKVWTIKAYDMMRYLKNEDTIVFGASTLTARFKQICETIGLPYRVLDSSTYSCTAVIQDKKTYFTMLKEAIDETATGYGLRYGIRDNAGTMELYDYNRMISKIVLGDQSLMTDYDYEATIDEAYNYVKVIREDKDSETRQIFTAYDKKTIDTWGKLQLVENVSDADLNSAQLQQQANDLLKANNFEKKTLRFPAVGNIALQAGSSFVLRLSDLHRDRIANDNLALITHCTHNLSPVHTMDLEVEVLA